MNNINMLTNELNLVYNLISKKILNILTKKLNNDYAFLEDYEITCANEGIIKLDRIYVGQMEDGNLIPVFCSGKKTYSLNFFVAQEILYLLEYLNGVKTFI